MEGIINSVASVLEFLGTIFTSILGWFGEVFNVIVENPLLLIIVAIPIVFGIIRASIGIVRKLGLRAKN